MSGLARQTPTGFSRKAQGRAAHPGKSAQFVICPEGAASEEHPMPQSLAQILEWGGIDATPVGVGRTRRSVPRVRCATLGCERERLWRNRVMKPIRAVGRNRLLWRVR